jgi:proteasome lid subunit RPN8/RPN11
MHPAQQLRAFQELENRGLEMVAIWHSHPAGPARLSPTDLAEACYPEAALLVVSPETASDGRVPAWRLCAFRLVAGRPVEVNLATI